MFEVQVLLTSQRGQVHSTVGASVVGTSVVGSSVGSSVVPLCEHSLLLDWQGTSIEVAVGEKYSLVSYMHACMHVIYTVLNAWHCTCMSVNFARTWCSCQCRVHLFGSSVS